MEEMNEKIAVIDMQTKLEITFLYKINQQVERRNKKLIRSRINQKRYESSKKGIERYVKKKEACRNKYAKAKKSRVQMDKCLHYEQFIYEHFYKQEQQCQYKLESTKIDQKQNIQFEQQVIINRFKT
jgi:hypothetical protein